ncbi:MAG TPA: hypothetical protein VFL12_05850 [Thermoanaerobaculia bacterium]|nr:hypothetical protein [Thermoanaerobaculia bacterium]
MLLLPAILLAVAPAASNVAPSRPPEKGCAWERISDTRVGLEAWVQRCDFGFRKIDLLFRNRSLCQHWSDGGEVDPLVDVYDLKAGESAQDAMRRVFAEKTPRALASRCVLVTRHDEFLKTPPGIERYAFVPDKAYEAELAKGPQPDGVPDPPCGDWGESADGIGYWESQPQSGARRILFVRYGQDAPLFDEQTLKLLPAK